MNESISLFITLPLSPVPLTEEISIPFSLANLLANGETSILSLGLLFETGFGSSLTSGFGSSLTSGFGSSLTSKSEFLRNEEISSPFEPIIAIILSTGAVDPSSIPI